MSPPYFLRVRRDFHANLCSEVLLIDKHQIASNADGDNTASKEIALKLAKQLGASQGIRPAGQTSGERFEHACLGFVGATFQKLSHLRPGRWIVTQASGRDLQIADFEQYSHLKEIERITKEHPQLRTVLGADYFIKPDVVIFREPEEDKELNKGAFLINDTCTRFAPLRKKNGGLPSLHASISCKWTIRSDRSQNSRSEALNLVRNRKGHTPHIVVVTAEPLPSRLASIALGTGDIDCVYHFALTELIEVVESLKYPDAQDSLRMLVEGKRLRDISDLPLDLSV